jgi:hypothetical protein
MSFFLAIKIKDEKMSKFLSPDLISKCFGRLSAREAGGKKHLERTSALLYFLAFDATCKHFEIKSLDFTPETLQGRNHRKQFELEFAKLAVLERSTDILKQVTELGRIDLNGTSPEQRISSNFFSVPVKKASTRNEAYLYPNRPKAPVLSMGKATTEIPWGVGRYNHWQLNFPKLLSEIKYPTPNIDLALFAIRDVRIRQESEDIFSVMLESLRSKFTIELCEYFSGKFEKEKIFANHLNQAFSGHYKNFVNDYVEEKIQSTNYKSMKKEDLIERILFLENELKKNNITI